MITIIILSIIMFTLNDIHDNINTIVKIQRQLLINDLTDRHQEESI